MGAKKEVKNHKFLLFNNFANFCGSKKLKSCFIKFNLNLIKVVFAQGIKFFNIFYLSKKLKLAVLPRVLS